MAEARFFHTFREDHVVCFYCGVGLSDWKDEDPWKRHALWTNGCPYLMEKKGGYIWKI
jgi:E3 ubiquitin-protein ligase XIAP